MSNESKVFNNKEDPDNVTGITIWLPTEINKHHTFDGKAELTKFGCTFTGTKRDGDLLQEVILPFNWRIEDVEMDHWTKVVDHKDIERISIYSDGSKAYINIFIGTDEKHY